jgi:hypothetical protein
LDENLEECGRRGGVEILDWDGDAHCGLDSERSIASHLESNRKEFLVWVID